MRSGFPPRKGTNEIFMFIPEIRENCAFLGIVWSFDDANCRFVSGNHSPAVAGGPSCQSPRPACTFCPPSISLLVLIGRLQPDTQRVHTWSVCVTVSVAGQWGWKRKRGKHGGGLQVVFLPSPFKSTLRHVPLWPLMLPVHLAKRSGETQDHRNGQKQFHPLSEPISTRHSEEKKQKSDMFRAVQNTN